MLSHIKWLKPAGLLISFACFGAPAVAAEEHHHHDMDMEDEDMADMDHGMSMSGVFGPYTSTRDASGTSWQPDTSKHEGIHLMDGDWMFMLHGELNGVYDWQEKPRGDDKGFLAGMFMATARRDFGSDTLNVRAM